MRLLELLCASSLFLTAVLAMAPLTARGRLDVALSLERSRAASHAQDGLEHYGYRSLAEPLVARSELYDPLLRVWRASEPAAPGARWERRVESWTLPLAALSDGRLTPEEEGGDGPLALRLVTVSSRRLGRGAGSRVSIVQWVER